MNAGRYPLRVTLRRKPGSNVYKAADTVVRVGDCEVEGITRLSFEVVPGNVARFTFDAFVLIEEELDENLRGVTYDDELGDEPGVDE